MFPNSASIAGDVMAAYQTMPCAVPVPGGQVNGGKTVTSVSPGGTSTVYQSAPGVNPGSEEQHAVDIQNHEQRKILIRRRTRVADCDQTTAGFRPGEIGRRHGDGDAECVAGFLDTVGEQVACAAVAREINHAVADRDLGGFVGGFAQREWSGSTCRCVSFSA